MDFYYRQTGQTAEQLRATMREDAVKQAERNLVISEILRTETLTVSDEEMEERIALLTQGDDTENSAQLAAFLRNESGRAVLESQLLRDKAIERILAIARGQADALDAAAAEKAAAVVDVDATDANATDESDTAATSDGDAEVSAAESSAESVDATSETKA
jgi:FKBP-type peptidyl-prolyl cis-trans isomerase (trigger factor)